MEVPMPAKTAKQQRYMAMCAHSPKKGCPPKKVAKEFSHKPKNGYDDTVRRGYEVL